MQLLFAFMWTSLLLSLGLLLWSVIVKRKVPFDPVLHLVKFVTWQCPMIYSQTDPEKLVFVFYHAPKPRQ